jgi:hypothetical protein
MDESRKDNVADWITWRRRLDVITGQYANVSDQNITYSALTTYLGARRIDHTSAKGASLANPRLDQVFRCPSDNLDGRPSHADDSHGYYRYSYAMNVAYANPVYTKFTTPNSPARVDGTFSGKISSIRAPAEKILLICQDEKTLEDG